MDCLPVTLNNTTRYHKLDCLTVSAPETGGGLPRGMTVKDEPSLIAVLDREEAAADAAAEAEAAAAAAAPPRSLPGVDADDDIVGSPESSMPLMQGALGAAALEDAMEVIDVRSSPPD